MVAAKWKHTVANEELSHIIDYALVSSTFVKGQHDTVEELHALLLKFSLDL